MTRLPLALILIASTAHATPWTIPDGNGGWVDNPACTDCPKTDPVAPEPSQPKGDTDRDPQPVTTEQHYGFCCRVDGVARYHTAWLRDPATAHAQCDARPIKPDCDEATAAQVRNADKAAKLAKKAACPQCGVDKPKVKL